MLRDERTLRPVNALISSKVRVVLTVQQVHRVAQTAHASSGKYQTWTLSCDKVTKINNFQCWERGCPKSQANDQFKMKMQENELMNDEEIKKDDK